MTRNQELEEIYDQYKNEKIPWWVAIFSLFFVGLLIFSGVGAIIALRVIVEKMGWTGVFFVISLIILSIFSDQWSRYADYIRISRSRG